jgi:6-phosphogluconolactonase
MHSSIQRRDVLAALGGAAVAGALPAFASAAEGSKVLAYLGTYTGGKSQGIYAADFDPATGKLGAPRLVAKTAQPSFLALHPSGKSLYACNESGDFEGKKAGAITAFAINADGSLQELNQKTSSGAAPCHLVVDKTGKNVLCANYTGGNVCVYSLKADGSLNEQTALVQHQGPRIHAHSVNLDAANRFAFVADLGLDKVMIYKFDADHGTLTPNDPPAGICPKGGGPRHFAFHPTGKFAYVCEETSSAVTAFAYDAAKGSLTELQTLSTLPTKVEGNSTAEVQVHPTGKFVYVSNRGHNSIAIFKVDPATGKLTAAGHQGKDIKVPRNFGIDPSGKWMVVCSQDGDHVNVFQIDQNSGALEPTDIKIEVGAPVCVKFLVRK